MSPSGKPFSQACENNKAPILEVISGVYQFGDTVLEIGSGTAQHARHFASHLSYLQWQPAELPENLAILKLGLADHGLSNISYPLTLEVGQVWPESANIFEGVYSANCLHIMSAALVEKFFEGVSRIIKPEGNLCVYGPFKYQGVFTSASNARFDEWLKGRDERSGIRDFEWVNELAEAAGFTLVEDHSLPANNQLIHWRQNA